MALSNKRVLDSDDEAETTSSAKQSPGKKPKLDSTTKPEKQKDSSGNVFWELSSKRRVTINKFKNMHLVDVRETYEKDGQTLPGKKGISLTIDQFGALMGLLPDLERELRARGEHVSRPVFAETSDTDDTAAAKEVSYPKHGKYGSENLEQGEPKHEDDERE